MDLNMNMAEKALMEDLVSGSNVLSEEEYRGIVLAISEYACSIVTKTLGPYGKTTNVDDSTFTAPTKDGWTVLRSLRFSDPLYNSIYNVINQISFDLVTKVGDGTTSALTGANVFLHAILKEIENPESPLYKMRQSDLLANIEKVKDKIVSNLSNSSEIKHIDPAGNFEDIYKIAYISSNGNEKLARAIQHIYKEAGNPNIYVTLDSGDDLKVDILDGYKYDCNIINQKVYRNSEDGTYVLNEPFLVAIFDHNVTYNEHKNIISGLSNYASQRNTSVLLVAPYFDDIITNILNTTINSFVQQRKIPNLIMMQVPLASNLDRKTLSDFTLLTNAQIFDYGKVRALNVTVHNANPNNAKNKIEDDLLDIEQYHFESTDDLIDTCIGHINHAVIADKYIVISRYESVYNEQLYNAEIEQIKNDFIEIARRTQKSSNMLSKDYLEAHQRYIKMLGKMGTIKVGAQTELEKHCLKDWVDDAVLACRSAFNNGYIRGLNLSTLSIIDNLIKDMDTNLNIGEVTGKNTVEIKRDLAVAKLFYNVFMEMSLTVLRNKYPDIEKVNESGKLVNEEIEYDVTFYDKDRVEVKPYTNSTIMEALIHSDKTFDLVTDSVFKVWTVINSLSTDIEILNSVVGVLSILLTSDQYISLNKGYDKKMSRKLQLEREQEKAAAIEYGKLQGRLKFFMECFPDASMKKAANAVLNSSPFPID